MGVCAGSSSRTFSGTVLAAATGRDGLSAVAPVAIAPAPNKTPDISPAVTPRNNVRFTTCLSCSRGPPGRRSSGHPGRQHSTDRVGTTPVAGELRSHLVGTARAAADLDDPPLARKP